MSDAINDPRSDSACDPISQWNPYDPAVIESPWAFFAALRRHAPLYELPNKAYYLITRYEDVMRAVMDTETFSSNLVAVLLQSQPESAPQFLDLGTQARVDDGTARAVDVLAIADPPAHTRQRRVPNRAFTMRRVEAMTADIQALADELVDRFEPRGQCDWVAEFASCCR